MLLQIIDLFDIPRQGSYWRKRTKMSTSIQSATLLYQKDLLSLCHGFLTANVSNTNNCMGK